MALERLECSGGHATVDITGEERAAADLGVGKLFLARLGSVEDSRFASHYCRACGEEFHGAPGRRSESPGEEVAEGMVLAERGQYLCKRCGATLGEYRVFGGPAGGAGA